jgi:hypothetical protein
MPWTSESVLAASICSSISSLVTVRRSNSKPLNMPLALYLYISEKNSENNAIHFCTKRKDLAKREIISSISLQQIPDVKASWSQVMPFPIEARTTSISIIAFKGS